MATISFSPNIRSQVDVDTTEVEGDTLGDAMNSLFSRHPGLKTYLLNDDGSVRKHVAFVINGTPIKDRNRLSDSLSASDDIFVMQALSGG